MKRLKAYWEHTTTFKRLSDLLFFSALSISSYTLITTYLERSRLPEGVCPINSNQNLYYLSISLLIVAFVITFFEHKAK